MSHEVAGIERPSCMQSPWNRHLRQLCQVGRGHSATNTDKHKLVEEYLWQSRQGDESDEHAGFPMTTRISNRDDPFTEFAKARLPRAALIACRKDFALRTRDSIRNDL